MSSTPYVLTNDWSAANRIDAAADTDILVTNPNDELMFFDVTKDTNPPTLNPGYCHLVLPKQTLPLKLKAGESLWIAKNNNIVPFTATVLAG